MVVYLIRHADAVPEEQDPERPLSARGHEQVARLGTLLGPGSGFSPAEFWHSPLARARETAVGLAVRLEFPGPILLTAGLLSEDNPALAAALIARERRDVAVFGHEPHLGLLASLLTGGPGGLRDHRLAFPKAGVLALHGEGRRWSAEWLVRTA